MAHASQQGLDFAHHKGIRNVSFGTKPEPPAGTDTAWNRWTLPYTNEFAEIRQAYYTAYHATKAKPIK